MTKDYAFQLTDIVRETAYSIHSYLGAGHTKTVYLNALVHRLEKAGHTVEAACPLQVADEDGFLLGEFMADLLVEESLLLSVTTTRGIEEDDIAQLLGWMRAASIDHGAVVNFGGPKFGLRKLGLLDTSRRAPFPL